MLPCVISESSPHSMSKCNKIEQSQYWDATLCFNAAHYDALCYIMLRYVVLRPVMFWSASVMLAYLKLGVSCHVMPCDVKDVPSECWSAWAIDTRHMNKSRRLNQDKQQVKRIGMSYLLCIPVPTHRWSKKEGTGIHIACYLVFCEGNNQLYTLIVHGA